MTLIYIISILILICEQYILRLLHSKHYFSYKNSEEENFLELQLTILLCKRFDNEYDICKRSIKEIDFIKIHFIQTKIKRKDF